MAIVRIVRSGSQTPNGEKPALSCRTKVEHQMEIVRVAEEIEIVWKQNIDLSVNSIGF